jgi:hypothetical protein
MSTESDPELTSVDAMQQEQLGEGGDERGLWRRAPVLTKFGLLNQPRSECLPSREGLHHGCLRNSAGKPHD